MPKPYFAAMPLMDKALAAELMARVDKHYDRLASRRAYQRARRNRALYYMMPNEASPFDGGRVGTAGDGGELSYLHINRMRHLGQRILSQAVTDDFGWQPVAANNDTASQEQAILAGSVLEYEKRERDIPSILRQTAEATLLDGEGWTSVRWDARGGEKYEELQDTATGTSQAVYKGQLKMKRHSWFRLVANWSRHDADHDWMIVTDDYVNKYDLAARYHEHKDVIVGLRPDHRRVLEWRRTALGLDWDEMDDELIPVYTLYHRPTDAVPDGREVSFVDGSTILNDGPLAYGSRLPLERMSAGDILDTPNGHAPMTDLSALQVIANMLISASVTNHINNGVSHIALPEDANVQPSAFSGGANFVKYSGPTPPSVLNLARTDPQTIELARLISDEMVLLAGMNEVSLGRPERQLSGAAMALLDAKSLEFATLFIASYRTLVARVGTAIVDRYKRFAKAPRRLEVISGGQRAYMLQEFVGEHIGDVPRVTVEVRSALLETTAGKLDFAEKAMAAPPEMRRPLVQIFKTGNLDTALQPDEHEFLLRERENEALRRGQVPPVLASDPHVEHIRAHRSVVASPEARSNPDIIAACSEHEQAHIDALRMTDPGLLLALGQQPIPPPGLPGMPMPGDMPPGEVAPPGDLGEAAGLPPPQPGEMPQEPSMPINPSTGERAPLPAIAQE